MVLKQLYSRDGIVLDINYENCFSINEYVILQGAGDPKGGSAIDIYCLYCNY